METSSNHKRCLALDAGSTLTRLQSLKCASLESVLKHTRQALSVFTTWIISLADSRSVAEFIRLPGTIWLECVILSVAAVSRMCLYLSTGRAGRRLARVTDILSIMGSVKRPMRWPTITDPFARWESEAERLYEPSCPRHERPPQLKKIFHK